MAEIPVQVEIRWPPKTPIYQSMAPQAAQMRARGVCVVAIAKHFRVDDHTAAKALRWFRQR